MKHHVAEKQRPLILPHDVLPRMRFGQGPIAREALLSISRGARRRDGDRSRSDPSGFLAHRLSLSELRSAVRPPDSAGPLCSSFRDIRFRGCAPVWDALLWEFISVMANDSWKMGD